MANDFRIRPARACELPALVALEERCFTGDRISPRQLKHWLTADNGLFLVAAPLGRNAAPIGYLLTVWRREGTSVRLYSIAIAPEARGKGLAQRLLQSSIRHVKRLGRSRYTLEVAAGNQAAIALYEKLGFVPFGRYPAYYQDGQDAVRMRKAL